MDDKNDFKDFYNLERENLGAVEKDRAAKLSERKKLFQSAPHRVTKLSILSKEKVMILVIAIILIVYIFPIVQAYFIKSKLSNTIREFSKLERDIASDLMFNYKIAPSTLENLPRFTYVNTKTNKIKVNIGETGLNIVDNTAYLILEAVIDHEKHEIKWQCDAYGVSLREEFLPANCRLLKR